jgi:hypothetical protein
MITPTPALTFWPFPRYVLRNGVLVMVRQRKAKPNLSAVEPAPF